MWGAAVQTESLRAVLARATVYRRHTLRLFGIPESEIAQTLRIAEHEGLKLSRLEITTCLKRGEIEVVTRYEPDAEEVYEAFVAIVRARHPDTLFSQDGTTVDEQVAALLLDDLQSVELRSADRRLRAGATQPGESSARELSGGEASAGELSGGEASAGELSRG